MKNDHILNELLNKEHNISSLEGLYNAYQKEMTLLHHSFLLYRVNQVYKEIKRRQSNPNEERPEGGVSLEKSEQALHIGSRIY